jgi:hypothetical protein
MNLINFLRKKEFINDIIIQDFKEFKYGFYIKLVCIFSNKFECHIKEYVDEYSRNYSYHFQNSEAKMIIRWDNALHHKNLITFPKFTQQQIIPAIGGGNVI